MSAQTVHYRSVQQMTADFTISLQGLEFRADCPAAEEVREALGASTGAGEGALGGKEMPSAPQ